MSVYLKIVASFFFGLGGLAAVGQYPLLALFCAYLAGFIASAIRIEIHGPEGASG